MTVTTPPAPLPPQWMALPAPLSMLPSCAAIGKAPRAAGYHGSEFDR